jgi:hypothetical protein
MGKISSRREQGSKECGRAMTAEALTTILAQRVMGWRVGPDRFILDGRRWLPRWRFQPCARMEDAFRLLECSAPQHYSMGADDCEFSAKVRICDITGEAVEASQPLALTLAIARAIGLEV